MIGKGKLSGTGIHRYLLEKEEAKIVMSKNLEGCTQANEFAFHFECQRLGSTSKREVKKNTYQIILSFNKTESKLLDLKGEDYKKNILQDFCQGMKKRGIDFSKTQMYGVEHRDKTHLHYHIVFNKVQNDGKSLRMNYFGKNAMNASREVAKEYGLIVTQSHRKGLTKAMIEKDLFLQEKKIQKAIELVLSPKKIVQQVIKKTRDYGRGL